MGGTNDGLLRQTTMARSKRDWRPLLVQGVSPKLCVVASDVFRLPCRVQDVVRGQDRSAPKRRHRAACRPQIKTPQLRAGFALFFSPEAGFASGLYYIE